MISLIAGKYKGKNVTVVDVFESVGKHAAGSITDKDLKAIKIGKKLGIKNYALSFTNNATL